MIWNPVYLPTTLQHMIRIKKNGFSMQVPTFEYVCEDFCGCLVLTIKSYEMCNNVEKDSKEVYI